ncbi:histidine phosphatase family protein [Bifidobacterium sp. ESL0764]|uniref:histidine phosphatase family protein n=1 Tax=Bifidobacterium sp. ESL0764 TaxID=2983228 RepID=UPI0023F7C779|nr:histidine phosphatase family protein [Bifidobacterium sp. ESL0764]WEV65924.1 histidine phosphatase family protein [Bifidobacterium sp. ESL0764]
MSNQQTDGTETVTIYLARHTQTTSNVMDIMQGWSDFPITEEGYEIIRNFGRGLKGITFDAAYAGNLSRHYATARGALDESGNKDVEIHVDPDLREANFGSFEGRNATDTFKAAAVHMGYKTQEEVFADRGMKAHLDLQDAIAQLDQLDLCSSPIDQSVRAEFSTQIQDRMTRALTKIADTAVEKHQHNVLVVSSGHSIREFLWAIDHDADLTNQENTATTKLTYRNGSFSIVGPTGSLEYRERGARL